MPPRSSRRVFRTPRTWAGLFSGYNPKTRHYNASDGHWGYQGSSDDASREPAESTVKEAPGVHGDSLMAGGPAHSSPRGQMTDGSPPVADAPGSPRCDPALAAPALRHGKSSGAISPATRRRWFASVCGCTAEEVVRVAELLCANSGRERTSAIVYAVG